MGKIIEFKRPEISRNLDTVLECWNCSSTFFEVVWDSDTLKAGCTCLDCGEVTVPANEGVRFDYDE